MHHRLVWCPMCGQQLAEHRTTYQKLAEEFPDLRQGY
jgi:hypothetical protein